MSEPASISTGIAARYATALFELAKEDKGLKALEADATALADALAVSPELVAMIGSPVVTRDEQAAAIAAIAKKMKLSALTSKTLALLASKRRLFVLPYMVTDVLARIAVEAVIQQRVVDEPCDRPTGPVARLPHHGLHLVG